MVETHLSEGARKVFKMLSETYKFQGPTYLKGRAEGEAEAILEFLDARGFIVTPAQRDRILACTDLQRLTSWVRKAATLNNVDELFEQ